MARTRTRKNLPTVDEAKEPRFSELRPEGMGELEGMNEFPQRLFLSFSPQHGRLECKATGEIWEEMVARILASRVVRVNKDPDGNILCQSLKREYAGDDPTQFRCGSDGVFCASCTLRWLLLLQTQDGFLYAHTLSVTGSANFQTYALNLARRGLLPSNVWTRIHCEEATRRKQGTIYRRLAFALTDIPAALPSGEPEEPAPTVAQAAAAAI